MNFQVSQSLFEFSLPACAFCGNLKNQLRSFLFRNPFFERGCKGTHYFLISKSFFKNFSIFIFLRQSVKELHFLYSYPFFERGCKGRHYFLISKSFFKNFSTFFFMPQSFQELTAFTAALFSNGIAKVRLFSLLPNLSATIFKQKSARTPQQDT